MAKYPGDYQGRATKADIAKQAEWARKHLRMETLQTYEMLSPMFGEPVRFIGNSLVSKTFGDQVSG